MRSWRRSLLKDRDRPCRYDPGLSTKKVAVDFIAHNTKADGISARKNVLNTRSEIGLFAIQRTFVVDSIALEDRRNRSRCSAPDAVEIMPGNAEDPKIMRHTDIPRLPAGFRLIKG